MCSRAIFGTHENFVCVCDVIYFSFSVDQMQVHTRDIAKMGSTCGNRVASWVIFFTRLIRYASCFGLVKLSYSRVKFCNWGARTVGAQVVAWVTLTRAYEVWRRFVEEIDIAESACREEHVVRSNKELASLAKGTWVLFPLKCREQECRKTRTCCLDIELKWAIFAHQFGSFTRKTKKKLELEGRRRKSFLWSHGDRLGCVDG